MKPAPSIDVRREDRQDPNHAISHQRLIARLSALIALEREARRQHKLNSLGFLIANRTHDLLPYFQAFIWVRGRAGSIRIQTVSGVSDVDQHAPAVRTLKSFVKSQLAKPAGHEFAILRASSVVEIDQEGWQHWFPDEIAWCPFAEAASTSAGAASPAAGFVILRNEAFTETDGKLLTPLTEAYGHAWRALTVRRRPRGGGAVTMRSYWWWLALAALALLATAFIPIRYTVLAQAEIVPIDPIVVPAPLDGVVDRVFVEPNQRVHKGQRLLSLDETQARNNMEVAESGYRIAVADQQLAVQKSFSDLQSKADLEVYSLRVKEKELELGYANEQLALTQVDAPGAGVVLFSDIDDWSGRPVVTGERIMTIADPNQVEVQIWLPVADGTHLEVGQRLDLFLDIDPANPLVAVVRQTAYEPEISPDDALAFRLKARLAADTKTPRLGLRGTAKIYGDDVSVLYFLVRRPWSSLRQYVGF